MKRDIEIRQYDIVIRQLADDRYEAVVNGRADVSGEGGSPMEALRALNWRLYGLSVERRQVRERAWCELRHTLRRSLGLPTWTPRWAMDRLGCRADCERFEALVRQVAEEMDAVNAMRPERGQRVGWPDVVAIVQARWAVERERELEEGGMKVVERLDPDREESRG